MIDINIKKSKGGAEGEQSREFWKQSYLPSSGSENEDLKKMRESLKKTATKLKKLGVSEVTLIMANRMPEGSLAVDQVVLATNVYGIRLPPIPLFRYDVTAMAFVAGHMFELTKQSRDDALCNDAFFGGEGNVVCCDCQKIVYSFSRLGNAEPQGTLRRVLTLSQEALKSLRMGDVEKVELTVSNVSGELSLILSDISRVSSSLNDSDRSLMQFIDIATSQYALFHPDRHLAFLKGRFISAEAVEGFRQEDCPSLPEGKYFCVGAHKSAGRVEGRKWRGSCNAAITINRLFAMTRIIGKDGSIFQITNFSAQSVRDTTFIYEDVNVTVEQYYLHKYQLELKHVP